MNKLIALAFSSLCVLASYTANAGSKRAGIDIGVAHDLDDLGLSLQFKRYTFFYNGDGAAFDVRALNFHGDKNSLHLYVDVGGFIISEDSEHGEGAGFRVPIGLTFGIEKNIELFIQAVPTYDFEREDDETHMEAAGGIRFRL